MKKLYNFLSKLLYKKHIHLMRSLLYLERETLIDTAHLDYARLGVLELCAHEVHAKNIKGSAAELGVFQGGFAKYMNAVFPDRPLYLFDTFEGFNQQDIAKEKKLGINYKHIDFSKTNIDLVLQKMKHPERCIVRKGFFPKTAEGLENETFCLVSLDADLYEPLLQGLEFFYQRLSPGGYIMVHDFNNDFYKGARKAVDEFCSANKVSFVPIPDIGGSVIINKPL